MTDKQVLEYIRLVDRKLEIITAPAGQWRESYTKELEEIESRLAELRPLVDAEYEKRRRPDALGEQSGRK